MNLFSLKGLLLSGIIGLGSVGTAVLLPDSQTAQVAPEPIVVQQQDEAPVPDPDTREALRELMRTAHQEALADLLGITVEEVQAAREARTLHELIEAAGIDREAVQAAMQAAHEAAIDQALADGLIDAETAEFLRDRPFQRRGHRGPGGPGGPGGMGFRPDVETVADILGISVEELEAAREEGTRFHELIEELGLDIETVHEALQAARAEAIQAALDNGEITEEQAERLLNREGRRGPGGPHGPGQGRGNGPGNGPGRGQGNGPGQGQGNGPGGPGNGQGQNGNGA